MLDITFGSYKGCAGMIPGIISQGFLNFLQSWHPLNVCEITRHTGPELNLLSMKDTDICAGWWCHPLLGATWGRPNFTWESPHHIIVPPLFQTQTLLHQSASITSESSHQIKVPHNIIVSPSHPLKVCKITRHPSPKLYLLSRRTLTSSLDDNATQGWDKEWAGGKFPWAQWIKGQKNGCTVLHPFMY